MAYQSLAMGEAFGQGYQYGKRRISSLSNEEFNKLDFKTLSKSLQSDISSGIPAMKAQMTNFATLQSDVIKELINYAKQLPQDIVSGFTGGGNDIIDPTAGGGGSSAWVTLGIFSLFDFWKWLGITDSSQADFTKQYKQSVNSAIAAQDARRLEEIRRQVLIDGAYERYLNRQTDTVTEPFKELTKFEAARAEIKEHKIQLAKLQVRNSTNIRRIKAIRLESAKLTSENNALGQTNWIPDAVAKIKANHFKLQKLTAEERAINVDQANIKILIRKIQDFIIQAQQRL